MSDRNNGVGPALAAFPQLAEKTQSQSLMDKDRNGSQPEVRSSTMFEDQAISGIESCEKSSMIGNTLAGQEGNMLD